MIIVKCDKCGKTSKPYKSNYSLPNEWKVFFFEIGYHENVKYELCPECVKLLKLDPKEIHTPSVGERLLEIITEIVQENLPS